MGEPGNAQTRDLRRTGSDSYNNNRLLKIPGPVHHPLHRTPETPRSLRRFRAQPAHELAADPRRAFSGIVTGNVKENGVRAIEKLGPYELAGDASVMKLLDELLAGFVAQKRMKLPGSAYKPCYRLVA